MLRLPARIWRGFYFIYLFIFYFFTCLPTENTHPSSDCYAYTYARVCVRSQRPVIIYSNLLMIGLFERIRIYPRLLISFQEFFVRIVSAPVLLLLPPWLLWFRCVHSPATSRCSTGQEKQKNWLQSLFPSLLFFDRISKCPWAERDKSIRSLTRLSDYFLRIKKKKK